MSDISRRDFLRFIGGAVVAEKLKKVAQQISPERKVNPLEQDFQAISQELREMSETEWYKTYQRFKLKLQKHNTQERLAALDARYGGEIYIIRMYGI